MKFIILALMLPACASSAANQEIARLNYIVRNQREEMRYMQKELRKIEAEEAARRAYNPAKVVCVIMDDEQECVTFK